MPRLFSSLKGSKSDRTDLNPSASQIYEPPAYTPSSSVGGDNPPPYHDWQSVPDTALLPPPPSLPNDYSGTSNASYDSAAKAHEWCERYPVYKPRIPSAALAENVRLGLIQMDPPARGFNGELKQVNSDVTNSDTTGNPSLRFRLRSYVPQGQKAKSNHLTSRFIDTVPEDQIFLSAMPLYFAASNHPFSTHYATEKSEPFTIYFEIRPLSFNSKDSTIAIGFASKPYPPWRQPGWHRASVGVHSDDGRRFVNDPWGGLDFVESFQVGDTIGLALVFYPQQVSLGDNKNTALPSSTPAASQTRAGLQAVQTKAFLTRNGRVEGSWQMNEERDAEKDEGIEGLQGEADLYAAIGTFGDVEVEIRFFPQAECFVPPS